MKPRPLADCRNAGSPSPNRLRRCSSLRPLLLAAALLALALSGAFGQSIIMPPPTFVPPMEPPAATDADTNLVDAATTETMPPLASTPRDRNPFRWGPVVFHPHISYSYTYTTGVPFGTNQQSGTNQPAGTNRQIDTIIQHISPGIALDLGKHWTLDYTPTIVLYEQPQFRDTVNHSVDLQGRTEYEDWTLALSQKCLWTDDPIAETAQQTDKESYATAFNAGYIINGDLSLDINFNQNLWFSDGFANSASSSFDWSLMNWLNHQWGPNLSAGAGIGVGFVDVGIGSDMTYEQFQVRASWRVARKVTFSANGGVEVRQFLSSSQPDFVTPIMGATLEYRPFEQTTLSLNADRSVNPSYFQSQVTATTRVTGRINQRLLKRLYLGVSGGYADTSYEATDTGVAAGREDTHEFFSVSLSLNILRRASLSGFFTRSRNTSSATGFTYRSDQMGGQFSFRY